MPGMLPTTNEGMNPVCWQQKRKRFAYTWATSTGTRRKLWV